MKRLEVVLDHVAADVPPEARAFFAGVAKVEAGQGPREHHVLDCVVEALVIARRAGDPTVERKGDIVGTKERAECLCHGAAVEGVRRRVLGVTRRRAQRLPVWVRLGGGVSVRVRTGDRPVWAPEPIVVLGFEAGDHRVAPGDVRHREHPRRLDEVEPAVDGEAKHAVVPLAPAKFADRFPFRWIASADGLVAVARGDKQKAQSIFLDA